MKYKNTAKIRQTFLDFFQNQGHQVRGSSSLIPKNDTSLLFTNAGMNQFKNVFLGKEKLGFSRATTSQRCMRAGGKHNDLENVGYTPSHHTFFEMLGNFSFGDYFKKKAINLAWELLTSSHGFNIPKDQFWITVHNTDHEAYDIWANEIGIPHERLIRMGVKTNLPSSKPINFSGDNFWKMADTGPCGPSTEIFYDRGDHFFGSHPGSLEPVGNRYVEIWNLVFMEYNRQEDGSIIPLPSPSIDTGMGLERIAAILQKAETNYDIDIFRTLIKHITTLIKFIPEDNSPSLRVIADHIRSCAFLIADGLLPSNEGRGYVLRHIIRRAVRHGYMLGIKETFFYKLVMPLIKVMGTIAEDIKNHKLIIENILKVEEEKFAQTLERGNLLLNEALSQLHGDILDGETAFRLYDTYGFPLELITEICREHQVKVDKDGFNLAMELQQQRSRKHNNFINNSKIIKTDHFTTIFQGHDFHQLQTTIVGIIVSHKLKDMISEEEEGMIILDNTPFYSESGGQVGDTGKLLTTTNNLEFIVSDTQKIGNAIFHIGKMTRGCFHIGNRIIACIDINRRNKICRNHSATHLLHATLRKILGNHVIQKGSLINEKYLRFDLVHFAQIQPQELRTIECMVNRKIIQNLPVTSNIMKYEVAKKEKDIIALFDDKYDKQVRVLTIGDFSTELCNGTHVKYTGEIGLFRINTESSIAAGIRRIEASTGEIALQQIQSNQEVLQQIRLILKTNEDNIIKKIHSLKQEISILKKNLAQLTAEKNIRDRTLILKQVIPINKTHVVINQLSNTEENHLRSIVKSIKKELKSVVIILATVTNKRQLLLIAAVTPDLISKLTANDLINQIIPKINGKGGGCQYLAQAYGTSVTILPTILSDIKKFITNKLL
ncbi:MAG: alanine--tRNA ligase [Candidatus Dasytiphilus stammeri]